MLAVNVMSSDSWVTWLSFTNDADDAGDDVLGVSFDF